MKNKHYGLIIVFFLLCLNIFKNAQASRPGMNSKILDINNVSIIITNIGTLCDSDYISSHAFWDVLDFTNGPKIIVYDQGFWVLGKIDNELHLTFSQWQSFYSPGPIINNKAAMVIQPEDSLKFRTYKITKGDDASNADYAEWLKEYGAPVDDAGNPLVFADQSIWTIYNGFDGTLAERYHWETQLSHTPLPPMPVEVHQMAYAYKGNLPDSVDIFSNVVFFEWTIINKGEQPIDSTFVGFWTDIDFALNDYCNMPAIDTTCQTGYCWAQRYDENEFGNPPAVGYTLLVGPIVKADGGCAIFKGKKRNGYRNLPLTSFHGIGDDSINEPLMGPIRKSADAWNAALGNDFDGNKIVDPLTATETKFPFCGDPVTNSGWLFPRNWSSGGAGFVIFSVPFNLAPNDTQWVMIALVPGVGKNRLDSITKMREKAAFLKSLPYDSLAFRKSVFTKVMHGKLEKSYGFKLFQNFPNPFNQIPLSAFKFLKMNLWN